MTATPTLLILGASQGVGQALMEGFSDMEPKDRLTLHAVSRKPPTDTLGIQWHRQDLSQAPVNIASDAVMSLGPVQYLVDHLKALPVAAMPKAVWALSSASTDFKSQSPNPTERELMHQIISNERSLDDHCTQHGIAYQVFKTTLLYGRRDRNVNRLAQLMKKLPLVPVLGDGRRAPVHVDDVASLMFNQFSQWSQGEHIPQGVWRLQGGEVLSYRQMLHKIALAQGLSLRLQSLPRWPVLSALKVAHRLGHLKDIEAGMLARQAMDLTVDDQPARQALGWAPRAFEPNGLN